MLPVLPSLHSAHWASARVPGALQMCTAIHRGNKHEDHHPPFPQEPVDRKYTRTTAEGLKAEGLHRCWDTRVTGYCDGYCGATNGVNRAPVDFPAIALTTDGSRLGSVSSVCVRPG